MWHVYILQSGKSGRFYFGSCWDPAQRLVDHNCGQTKSTRGRGPWSIVHLEEFATKAEAEARERRIKSWKSHRSIQELVGSQG